MVNRKQVKITKDGKEMFVLESVLSNFLKQGWSKVEPPKPKITKKEEAR